MYPQDHRHGRHCPTLAPLKIGPEGGGPVEVLGGLRERFRGVSDFLEISRVASRWAPDPRRCPPRAYSLSPCAIGAR
eukprot:6006698-Pyramimonas_sp.AAC.1